MMKKWIALLLAAMMLTGCMAAYAEGTDAVAETEETVVETAADQVLATINGIPVYQSMVDNVVDYYVNQYSAYGLTEDVFKPIALNYGLTDVLVKAKMDEAGFQLSEEKIAEVTAEAEASWEEEIELYITYYGAYFGVSENPTEEELAAAREQIVAMLAEYGTTHDSYISDSIDNARYNAFVDSLIGDQTVSDEDIQAAFDEAVAADAESYGGEDGLSYYEYAVMYSGGESYYTPAGYRTVDNFVIKVDDALLNDYLTKRNALEEQNEEEIPEDYVEVVEEGDKDAEEAVENVEAVAEPEETAVPVTEDEVNAARQAILDAVQGTVDEINTRVAAGEDFTVVTIDLTEKGVGMEGGNQYNVHKESIMYDPAFVAAAFSMEKIGDIAAPAVGEYGVYVLRYAGDVPAGPVELTDEIRATFAEELMTEVRSNAINEKITAWMAEANIEYTDLGVTYRDAAPADDEDAEDGDNGIELVIDDDAETEEPDAAEEAVEEPAAE